MVAPFPEKIFKKNDLITPRPAIESKVAFNVETCVTPEKKKVTFFTGSLETNVRATDSVLHPATARPVLVIFAEYAGTGHDLSHVRLWSGSGMALIRLWYGSGGFGTWSCVVKE